MKYYCTVMFALLFSALQIHAQSKFNYAEQWKTIDKLMNGVLPKSAMPEIDKLRHAALNDKAYGQLVKALVTRNACLELTEEKPLIAMIDHLKKDAETIPFPAKAVVYSLIAETYLDYWNQNRWRLYGRTAMAETSDEGDIETWDGARIVREIAYYYQCSLTDAELLRKIAVDDFAEALQGDAATRYLRPTLYDLLAHRMLDTYMNQALWFHDFSHIGIVYNPAFFGDAQLFAKIDLPAIDPSKPVYVILNLFRELTAFHLSQNNPDALADVTMKRFAYLKNKGTFEDVDRLYEEAMIHLAESCAGRRVWGKVACTLASFYRTQSAEWLGRPKELRSRYSIEAVKLCRKIEKAASSKDDRTAATGMLKELTQPSVDVIVEKTLLPHTPALMLVTYKNLPTAYLNIYRYCSEDLEEINREPEAADGVRRLLQKLERVASQTLVLPKQTDYLSHSFETAVDTLPAGNYLWVTSDKPHPEKDKLSVFSVHTVQVTDIKLLQRLQNDSRVELYVPDALSGKPLSDAHITLMAQEYDAKQRKYIYVPGDSLRTDTCGIAMLQNAEKYQNGKIRVSHHGMELTENLLYAYPSYHVPAGERTVFFTDRAIYRPGQTVYFKGILYKTDNDTHNRIKTKTESYARLMDVNGKELAKLMFTTNEFGSFNGSFTIPQGLLNGWMSIENDCGRVDFQVEEYKRPTFEITMDAVAGHHRLGDSITVSGVAQALAGYPVDGAKLVFNVVRKQQYRIFGLKIHPSVGAERHIATGTLYTDSKGKFTVKFLARADDIQPDDNRVYRFQASVDITDSHGETQTDMQEVLLSRVPLLLDGMFPKKIYVETPSTDSLKYPLRVTNLNGNAVEANVQVELWSLQTPDRLLRSRLWQTPDTSTMQPDAFAALFPSDPYLAEDRFETYVTERRIATIQAHTPKDTKVDLAALRDAPSGWYLIRMKAVGAQNATVTDSTYVQLQHADAPITNMNEWLTVAKTEGEPGDTAVFRVAGGADSSVIRYDVLFKDRLVERKWITAGRIPQSVQIPIVEDWRGGFAVSFAMVQNNREYTALHEITVPHTNQQLDIAFTSFRERLLPGEKEKWTLTVKNKKGERESAEMVAALYDASLDQFVNHQWATSFYPVRSHYGYRWSRSSLLANKHNLISQYDYHVSNNGQSYEQLLRKPSEGLMLRKTAMFGSSAAASEAEAEPMGTYATDEVVTIGFSASKKAEYAGADETGGSDEARLTAIPLRTDFSETAFFYPALRTNENGELSIEFTIPEALTRWKMLGFAHTARFKTGNISNSLITQKQVAISANLPRFFRVGDTLVLSAKVNNLTAKDMNGKAMLRLYDAFTMQPVDMKMPNIDGTQPFTAKAGQSTAVNWRLTVPAGLQAVTYRLTAQADNHTDGEERTVPVLSNRILVTETMPFMVRPDQRKDFRFDRLADYTSASLTHHRLTLEYTSNPVWYAVQALPYLMEYPYECAEQVFSRFYANALATLAANSTPRLKQIFNQWRSLPNSKTLTSNLENKQELKQALLEETPWIMQATAETERKKRVGLLFDLNRMANEQKAALEKLKAMQMPNGGFPWFAGCPEDRFVTQHIIAGLEHLRKLNALPINDDLNTLIERAMEYCDVRIREDYAEVRKDAKETTESLRINRTQLHYLYTCSFSKHYSPDQPSFDFYMRQAESSWTHFNVYEQAMIALTMHRFGKTDVAQNILRSLKERAQTDDDLGMYWADSRTGYFWNESPVETQTMLIEAFNEAGSDTRAVDEMKIWLLRNKQTTDWKTTKATSEAIFALLSTSDDWLGNKGEPLDIRINGKPLKKVTKEPLRSEAGTGYTTTSWSGNDVTKSLANLRITNPNSGIVWGAAYWQYYEDADKITSTETALQINRRLFIKRSTEKGVVLEPITGSNRPRTGDVVTVHMELRADRDFEYVHLKDMRASGFEPVNTLSGYRYRDGLGYYESIKDASVNFFISDFRKGTYLFEYDLRVANAGDFSTGITTFQCMYAPEFNAHSRGNRVNVP